MLRKLIGTIALTLAVSSVLSSPAGASEGPMTIDPQALVARLSPADVVKWRTLSNAQQREALALLADPRLGRGLATQMEARRISSSLDVVDSSGTVTPTRSAGVLAAVATTYEVHSWYARAWTIFGITYSTTRLDYYYVTGSGIVQYDHYCTASYSNRVPMRSMSAQVNHFVSGGKGTCVATWTLTKLNFWSDTSDQGMRVNGAGVESTWGP